MCSEFLIYLKGADYVLCLGIIGNRCYHRLPSGAIMEAVTSSEICVGEYPSAEKAEADMVYLRQLGLTLAEAVVEEIHYGPIG